MTLTDRIVRSAFVALAVGLGWGIRGDFGHLIGAMYPGACLAMGFAYVSRQRSLFLWMPVLAAVSAIGIGSGGAMSYGMLHGYAQADTFINYTYGFLTLFLQGAAWGTFGGAMVGLVLEREQMRTGQWLGLIGTVMAAWFTSLILVTWLGLQINPPRNNTSITFMGAALAQLFWLAWNKKWSGFRGGLLGYLGFGLGMSGGRLLGNIANVLQTTSLDFSINHWNVMETSCGMIGGFVFAFGMLKYAYPTPPERENLGWTSALSITFVLGVIPLWHRLTRIQPDEKLARWAGELKTYGYENAEQVADSVLRSLDAVCVAGFVGAAIWMLIHFRRWQPLAWFPVLWLSLTMLLFQNLNALYFWYPHREKQFNMHTVFWVLLGLLAAYVVASPWFRPRPSAEESQSADVPVPWPRWIALSAAYLVGIVLVAGFVNGEATMRSANTRWPQWSWSEGPFPGKTPAQEEQAAPAR